VKHQNKRNERQNTEHSEKRSAKQRNTEHSVKQMQNREAAVDFTLPVKGFNEMIFSVS
jgi:hypothetical protein